MIVMTRQKIEIIIPMYVTASNTRVNGVSVSSGFGDTS